MCLERLIAEKKAGFLETYISPSEVAFIKRALKEAETELEGEEFQARLGIPLDKIKQMPIFGP